MLPSVARTPVSGYYAANAKITRSFPRERGLLCRKQTRLATRRNQKKLLDRLRDRIRLKNYSYRTEKTYVGWARRYILFHNKRHPQEMGHLEIESFLTQPAVERNVAPSTQNQALHAILFLYREVLEQPIPERINAVRARQQRRLPVVLTTIEVESLLSRLFGAGHLAALLLYGSGLRVRECLSPRIKV